MTSIRHLNALLAGTYEKNNEEKRKRKVYVLISQLEETLQGGDREK